MAVVALHSHRIPLFAAHRAMGRDPVPVAGIAKMTTIDYPHHLSAVLFLQGCPWRCAYCQNRELQPMKSGISGVPWGKALEFLASRKGLLDAVVFSGGEPTFHPGLPAAIREARSMGFRIGLHTNGMFPDRVGRLLAEGLVDWIGIDVKATRWLYGFITGADAPADAVYQTLRLLCLSGVPFEARATVYRPLLGNEEILDLARELRDAGVRRLKLQPWRPERAPGEMIPEEDLGALQARVDTILHSEKGGLECAERATGFGGSLLTAPPPAAAPSAALADVPAGAPGHLFVEGPGHARADAPAAIPALA